MNLHQVVSGCIAAVNPFQPVVLKTSNGYLTNSDGSRTPRYAMADGCSFTASIVGTVLTVTGIDLGTLAKGQAIVGTGITLGTTISGQLSGTVGGVGTYSISRSQNFASGALSSTSLSGQLQELTARDLKQLEGLNLQGSSRSIYINGMINGVVRVSQLGGDLIILQDGNVYLTTDVLEQWDVGWVKVAVTLQDGS